jgi:hypothetical protein
MKLSISKLKLVVDYYDGFDKGKASIGDMTKPKGSLTFLKGYRDGSRKALEDNDRGVMIRYKDFY